VCRKVVYCRLCAAGEILQAAGSVVHGKELLVERQKGKSGNPTLRIDSTSFRRPVLWSGFFQSISKDAAAAKTAFCWRTVQILRPREAMMDQHRRNSADRGRKY